MTKLRFHHKEQRVLRFLKGSLNTRVLERLKTRGFTPTIHELGQNLLGEAVRIRAAVPQRKDSESLVSRIVDLEKAWVPVAQAALEHRFPKVYAEMFRGYQRASGIDVMLMLRLFLDRVALLRGSTEPESQAASVILAERGLTPELVAEIESVVDQAMSPAAPGPSTPEQAVEAESAMWSFYLEWSRIARTVVKERDLRRTLGFRDGSGVPDPEEPEPVPVIATPQVNGPAPPGP